MTKPISTPNLRDAVHEAFGSPPIRPSMLNAIERAFEGVEETAYDAGHDNFLDRDAEKLLMDVLDVLDSPEVPGGVFQREKWKQALRAVIAGRVARDEIPF